MFISRIIKFIIVIILNAQVFAEVLAQDGVAVIDLSKEKLTSSFKDYEIIGKYDMGANGWLVLYGAGLQKLVKIEEMGLHFTLISSAGKRIWTTPIERKTLSRMSKVKVYISGTDAYFMEFSRKGPNSRIYENLHVTRIDINGKKTSASYIEQREMCDNFYGAVFDGDKIYSLSYNFGKYEKAKYSVFNLDLAASTIIGTELDLPILSKRRGLFYAWLCVGARNDLLYFYNKSASNTDANGALSYEFVKVSLKGKVEEKFSIKVDLATDKFFSPCRMECEGQTFIFSKFRYNDGGSDNPSRPGFGSLGGIYADVKKGFLFSYGMYNKTDKNNFSSLEYISSSKTKGYYSGYYVNKYDLSGKLIWASTYDFPAEWNNNNKSLVKGPFALNECSIKVDEENDQVECLFYAAHSGYEEKEHAYFNLVLNENGKFIKSKVEERLSNTEKKLEASLGLVSDKNIYHNLYKGKVSYLMQSNHHTKNIFKFRVVSK